MKQPQKPPYTFTADFGEGIEVIPWEEWQAADFVSQINDLLNKRDPFSVARWINAGQAAEAEVGNWLTNKDAAKRLHNDIDDVWSFERCKSEISRLCKSGKIRSTGKGHKRRVDPAGVDALALRIRNASLEEDSD